MQRQAQDHDRQELDPDSALSAFIARKLEIDTMLQRLAAFSDDHFGVSPEEVHWGHVGTLGRCAELLRQVGDSTFREGEYAA
ncbi:MAG TPA: hypothetical protein PKA33_15715 [Amaricoccus sp.]|uniref:hypothetical protein n=1 Tax=Amaricoccus sp. TaxID=1872485 RepID=UPI002BBC3207|nr:hypothetical protein [Amaricoccus sp.]HMR54497.1 hypothetical protein [Amaricoccus sp.]HMU00796.1 hypothetical protein [Amaricoccus sp.]